MNAKSLSIWIAAVTGIAILCFSSDVFLLIIHQLTNIFASGRNPVRVFLFLAFFAAMLITGYIVCRNIMPGSKKEIAALRWAALSLMVIIFTLNSLTFFWFTRHYQIPSNRDNYIVAFHEGEITSTQFIHSHFGKAAIALLVTPFSSVLPNADPGLGMNPFLPAGYGYVCAALVIILLCLLVLQYMRTIRGQPKPFFYTLIYSLLSFSILKNTIDGGLFSENALVPIIFYFILLCESNSLRVRGGIIALAAAFSSHYIIYTTGNYGTKYELLAHLHTMVVWTAVLIALAYGLYGTSKRLLVLMMIAACILMMNWSYPRIGSLLDYHSSRLTSALSIVGTLRPLDRPDLEKLFTLGRISYYRYHQNTSEQLRVEALLKETDALDNYYPISVENKTCKSDAFRNAYFTLHTPVRLPVPETGNEYFSLTFFEKAEIAHGWSAYDAILTVPSCMTRDISLIQEAVEHAGVKHFIIYGIH